MFCDGARLDHRSFGQADPDPRGRRPEEQRRPAERRQHRPGRLQDPGPAGGGGQGAGSSSSSSSATAAAGGENCCRNLCFRSQSIELSLERFSALLFAPFCATFCAVLRYFLRHLFFNCLRIRRKIFCKAPISSFFTAFMNYMLRNSCLDLTFFWRLLFLADFPRVLSDGPREPALFRPLPGDHQEQRARQRLQAQEEAKGRRQGGTGGGAGSRKPAKDGGGLGDSPGKKPGGGRG